MHSVAGKIGMSGKIHILYVGIYYTRNKLCQNSRIELKFLVDPPYNI